MNVVVVVIPNQDVTELKQKRAEETVVAHTPLVVIPKTADVKMESVLEKFKFLIVIDVSVAPVVNPEKREVAMP